MPKPEEQIGELYLFKRLTFKENEIKKSMSISEIYDHIRMVDHEDYEKLISVLENTKFLFLRQN